MNLVHKSKSWLRLLRAHTVILEAPMAFLGAAIGLGTVYDPRVGLWLLFGVLYHLVGYGMNSYVDWDKGFDKEDQRKQHHPLNTGDIHPDTAKKVIYAMTVALVIYMLVLVDLHPPSVGLSVLMIASGLAYNYLGKYITLKAVPISIAHTLVFFIPYYTYARTVTPFIAVVTAAYFVHHIYQIAISGDIKDIDQDEASLLKSMGATVKRYDCIRSDSDEVNIFKASNLAMAFAYLLTITQFVLSAIPISETSTGLISVIIVAVFGGLTLINTDLMIRPGPFLRQKRLRYISQREFTGYSMVHSISIVVIGLEVFAAMMVCMVVYLGLVSKFIWGNWLVPEV